MARLASAASACAAKSGAAIRFCQLSVASAGRRASETNSSRPCAAGSAKRHHLVAGNFETIEQCLHGELRMAESGCALRAAAADKFPSRLIEIRVEPGQHDRAARQARDGRQQRRRRRHRAGRARRDHGSVRAGKARGFRRDQPIAPCRRFDRAMRGQKLRPGFARDLQELQRELPILVDLVRHQPLELVPGHLPRRHVVHQAGEVVGERQSGGRSACDQRNVGLCRALRPPISGSAGQAAICARVRPAPAADRAPRRRSAPVAASAKATSSSSMSPSATMRGRMAACPASASRKRSRASRHARRVGR